MKNRESLYPGRVKLTAIDEANGIYDLTRADEPQEEGTPLNKKLLDYAVAACGITAGTATALTLDDEFGGFTLVDGAKVNFRLHVASGANPTLNVNGTGQKTVFRLSAGIPAGTWITAVYCREFDAFVASGSAQALASGSYVGDGAGEAGINVDAYGIELRTVSLFEKNSRDVLLPFVPSSIIIYTLQNLPYVPLYQGETITANVSGKITAGKYSKDFTETRVNVPVIKLEGNVLKLVGTPVYTLNQKLTASEYNPSYITDMHFTSFSDDAINSLGGGNVAGVTYNYIAF